MQSLNSDQEPNQDQISFQRNESFKSTKILLYQIKECVQSKDNLNSPEESVKKQNYGLTNDTLPELETLPGQIATISARNLGEVQKHNITEEGMSSTQSSNSNIASKFLSSAANSNDFLRNLASNSEERSNMVVSRRKKVGDIVSTSRSGHLIEKKDEAYCSALKRIVLDADEGCDTNDNIINKEVLSCEMFDINDNPNNERNEETSLSDNAQSEKSDSEAPCGIGLLERLIRSHPVWFLPGIQRAGAVHLLQGKEEGNFIVRQSSQPDTMAVSVRLPTGKGPYIEHYLIQAIDGQLSLESSENMFESIPSLIAHYCQCCDELPVRLTLPGTIRDAKNRQQLSSLALLGQEFWRYPMANPRPPESHNCSPNSNKSDSFGSTDCAKKIKENDEIILDLMPIGADSQPSSLLGTFKSSPGGGVNSLSGEEVKPKRPHTLNLVTPNFDKTGLVNGNKTPPQPPPRWTKPTQCIIMKPSAINAGTDLVRNNPIIFNETECVLPHPKDYSLLSSFSSVDYDHNISSPQSDQTNMKSFGFKRDKKLMKLFNEGNKFELISPVSDSTNFVSKSLEKVNQQFDSCRSNKLERNSKRYKKDGKVKSSAHYQESDILESPTFYYYKSNVADKQSDYEDIWATESFTTFKPPNVVSSDQEHVKPEGKNEMKKPPDLLERVDNSVRMSFKEKREDKPQQETKPNECQSFEAQVTEQFDGKQSSPFYAEPADALVVRRKGKLSFNKSRHSDPFSFNNWSIHMSPYFSGGNLLGRIDSQNDVNDDLNWRTKPSLSFDNIINLKKKDVEAGSRMSQRGKNAVKAKPVRPPKIISLPLERTHQTWAVDSSWEFIGNEVNEKEGEGRFPSIEQQMDSDNQAAFRDTVQEMIAKRFPHFKISQGFWNKNSENRDTSITLNQLKQDSNSKSSSRISAYDNLTNDRFYLAKVGNEPEKNSEMNCDTFTNIPANHDRPNKSGEGDIILSGVPITSDTLRYKRRGESSSIIEDNEDAQTIFSEPWDSSRWETLLPSSREQSFSHVDTVFSSEMQEYPIDQMKSSDKTLKNKICNEGLDLPMSLHQTGLKSTELSTTGASIRSYALHLASDKSTTFAQNIDNFIECTLESKEASPQIVMRNMRQFMSGMKNYLVKHGEREFEKQVEEERMKLKSTEFLNLDAILEGVMHKLVVRPLREHLYKLFVDEYVKTGAIQLLYENLSYARTKSLRDLGLKMKISPPTQDALEMICHFISKLQELDSPLEKLDHLLASVSTLIYSVKQSNQGNPGIVLGADDILPLFVWVLVQSGFIAAEIEAEYMWGLLHPSLLSGEGCYYLTTLSSAIHVLKNFKSCDLDQTNRMTSNDWQCGDLKSVLKIIVPDEMHGSILTKTLPVKPNMTTKDVCKIIAHKIRITNPQDYGLFRLVDGEETLLNDTDCPQDVKCKFVESGKHCTLAYKRIDAKIGWPRTT
ncbi:hypothetical protein RUM43_001663 [Polyplax serrata]|uniref:Protein sprint n=1 Tax=Polyplax serrata TaxID=468196 RepID=A0AAN8XSI4_POLSC